MNSQLLAMSFDTPASPWITLRALGAGEAQAAGWGFAWYPIDDNAAVVIKDPGATIDTSFAQMLGDWSRFRSTVFVCHIRGAAKRVTQQDTHPFVRSYAGRNFIFAHNGDLRRDIHALLPLGDNPVFEPLGRTDSEHAFCWLMTRIRDCGVRFLADVGWKTLHGWFRELDALGTANFILTDGVDLAVYRDEEGFSGLHWSRRTPPGQPSSLENQYLEIDVSDPLDHSRTMLLVSTTPLSAGGWTPLDPGQMLVARRAALAWISAPGVSPATTSNQAYYDAGTGELPPAPQGPAPRGVEAIIVDATEIVPQGTDRRSTPSRGKAPLYRAPDPGLGRQLEVHHETVYSYRQAVEHSSHLFRLEPVHDPGQDLLEWSLDVAPEGDTHRFEDVFGNRVLQLVIDRPYRKLVIRSTCRVLIRPAPSPLGLSSRATIPLVWMPWQRQMMLPYLLPPELPETQLRELSEFAMSFVERQDFDLLETLNDMNRTLNKDFRYITGSTTLETTPYEVYANRQGVCQDFANLYICMARLLNIPARYRVGYIFTGGDHSNQLQSEASHAWVELYLPSLGWRGFDPTNGCLAEADHVRVAVGRNYRDATPTSGTIYRGGSREKLRVNVRVTPVEVSGEPAGASELARARPGK